MGLLDNTRRIIREDYDKEYHGLIDKLGFVLNSFMEQVVTQVNGNLDTANLVSDIVTITVTVDANGIPIGNDIFKSTVTRPVGTTVINSSNKTDPDAFPTSQPYITVAPGTNTKLLKIRHISGLQANNEYTLIIKVE